MILLGTTTTICAGLKENNYKLSSKDKKNGIGFLNALKNVEDIDGNVIQVFLKPNLKINCRISLSDEACQKCKDYLKENDLIYVCHSSYLINSAKPLLDPKVKAAFNNYVDDLIYMDKMGGIGCVMHMGKKMNIDNDIAIKNMCKFVNNVVEETSDLKCKVILENSAHQGTEIGFKLEEISKIFNGIDDKYKNRVGICWDTCHGFASGYDFRSKTETEKFIKDFDTLIGINNLVLIHLNDSKEPLNSKRDRHFNFSKGYITNPELGGSYDGIKVLLEMCEKNSIPIVLETPDEVPLHTQHKIEIQLLKNLVN